MKRFVGRSCFGLLFLIALGGTMLLFVFTVFFQQSQATLSNATRMARPTSTNAVNPILTDSSYPSATAFSVTIPADDVTIQVDTGNTTTVSTTQPLPTLDVPGQVLPTSTGVPLPSSTLTDAPRNSGTSTYPLTETAEVMLAQTDVAHYESGVGATRTAIAAESAYIYGTLTAAAPTQSEVVP
ncbi:MAG: hypothetical protein ACYDBJ_21235 [Aggregatilineales bacterium]